LRAKSVRKRALGRTPTRLAKLVSTLSPQRGDARKCLHLFDLWLAH
jgi:hypothetical protein